MTACDVSRLLKAGRNTRDLRALFPSVPVGTSISVGTRVFVAPHEPGHAFGAAPPGTIVVEGDLVARGYVDLGDEPPPVRLHEGRFLSGDAGGVAIACLGAAAHGGVVVSPQPAYGVGDDCACGCGARALLYCVGRSGSDRQVKLLGSRFDLSQVEAALVAAGALAATAALVNGALLAHVVAFPPASEAQLLRAVGELVPNHMVPQRVCVVPPGAAAQLPSGKIDREAALRLLGALDVDVGATAVTPASHHRGMVERALQAVGWRSGGLRAEGLTSLHYVRLLGLLTRVPGCAGCAAAELCFDDVFACESFDQLVALVDRVCTAAAAEAVVVVVAPAVHGAAPDGAPSAAASAATRPGSGVPPDGAAAAVAETPPASSAPSWAVDLGACVDASPVVCAVPGRGTCVVVGSHAGVVCCTRVSDGRELWKYEVCLGCAVGAACAARDPTRGRAGRSESGVYSARRRALRCVCVDWLQRRGCAGAARGNGRSDGLLRCRGGGEGTARACAQRCRRCGLVCNAVERRRWTQMASFGWGRTPRASLVSFSESTQRPASTQSHPCGRHKSTATSGRRRCQALIAS